MKFIKFTVPTLTQTTLHLIDCNQHYGRRHLQRNKYSSKINIFNKSRPMIDTGQHRQNKRSLENHRQGPSNEYQHQQKRFPLDEQRFSQHFVPRNNDPIGTRLTPLAQLRLRETPQF